MKHQKYFLYITVIVVITIIIYLLLNKQYFILQSIEIPVVTIISSQTNNQSIPNRIDELSSRIDSKSVQPLFQSHISPYHPYLPIHIYTQNLTSLKGPSKLILLGNPWFGDEDWGLNTKAKPPIERMNQLACPYLADYCDITIDQSFFADADAVVYHMRDDINVKQANKYRNPSQRFVFTLWESPPHTPNLDRYKGFFNWTMTYRFKSHIIASYYFNSGYIHTSSDYYKFLIKENTTKNFNFKKYDHVLSDEMLANKKLGTVAAIISNCGGSSDRSMIVSRLKRYIDVKIYGRCGEKCPKNIDCREFVAKNYYFYLSFENSLCTDYTTEKFFDILQHPIVPIVYGRTNYSTFIPSSGFIDLTDFKTLSSLATHLNQTRFNKEKYLSYFSWKKDFVWGISQQFTALCDLCVRLHLDSTPNVIDDMESWWQHDACAGMRRFRP